MQHFEVKKEGGIPLHHDQLLPRKVDAEGVRYVEVFCSSFHTVLRADNGEVLMCGVERDTRRMVHKPVKVRRGECNFDQSPPTRISLFQLKWLRVGHA